MAGGAWGWAGGAGVRTAAQRGGGRGSPPHGEGGGRAGRPTRAAGPGTAPPMSGALTAVYHRYYHEADQRPNFYLDPVARELGRSGRLPASGTGTPSAVRDRPPRTTVLRPCVPHLAGHAGAEAPWLGQLPGTAVGRWAGAVADGRPCPLREYTARAAP